MINIIMSAGVQWGHGGFVMGRWLAEGRVKGGWREGEGWLQAAPPNICFQSAAV